MKAAGMRKQRRATITYQAETAPGIFDLRLYVPEMAAEAVPGQFADLYCADASRLLPRPISLAGIDRERGEIRLVYRVSGAGTAEFSGYRAGDAVTVLGPLGNGFPLGETADRPVLLVGGGIGIPPLLAAARALREAQPDRPVTAVLGYADGQTFLRDEFAGLCEVMTATEDGSIGVHGNVLDVLRGMTVPADSCVFACGPAPMLKALQAHTEERGLRCWLSLEERMACGVGACLACVCRTKETDEHSQVKNRRVCREGPVFRAEDVVF